MRKFFAGLYGAGVAIHHHLARLAPPFRLGVPVISVGNLTVGGTGKTELVVALAEHLRQAGYRPGVLSRGYKRRSRLASQAVSGPSGMLLDPCSAGDEPWLIASRLPGIPVWVDSNRYRGGQAARGRLESSREPEGGSTMSFAQPLLLFGLLAAAVPIIIHLIHKRRPREHKFAAIELLLRSVERVERRWRLRRFLLLAARVALIAALALAGGVLVTRRRRIN